MMDLNKDYRDELVGRYGARGLTVRPDEYRGQSPLIRTICIIIR